MIQSNYSIKMACLKGSGDERLELLSYMCSNSHHSAWKLAKPPQELADKIVQHFLGEN